MQLHQFIREHEEIILERAFEASQRGQHQDEAATRSRLSHLLELTIETLKEKNIAHILNWARDLAQDRFKSGLPLTEIQMSMNVIEEAIWQQCMDLLPPEALARALGLSNSVLVAAKTGLARSYVAMATGNDVPPLGWNSHEVVFEEVVQPIS